MKKRPPQDTPDEESSGSSLHPSEFKTHNLPGADQFDEFRATYGGVFDIFPVKSQDRTFPVHQKIWNLDKLVLVCARLPGPGYAFGWRHARRAGLDHWYAFLPCGGAAPEGLEGHAGPVSFHCLAQPFQSEIEAHGMLMLFIPRDLVAADMDPLLDRKLDNGAGLLLADFLALLCRRLPRLRPCELPGVLEAIRGLIAACAMPSGNPLPDAHGPIDLRLLDRARRLVEHRIAEPDLSPASLCRDLSVSRSSLYRTFEPLGGVSAHIRRQRLLRARDALLDAVDARSIARIADEWGFADASTFSRAFKHEFGLSPRAARKMGWTESGHRKADPPHPEDAADLHLLLRRLRP